MERRAEPEFERKVEDQQAKRTESKTRRDLTATGLTEVSSTRHVAIGIGSDQGRGSNGVGAVTVGEKEGNRGNEGRGSATKRRQREEADFHVPFSTVLHTRYRVSLSDTVVDAA